MTFKLVNKGKNPHNFRINGKTSKQVMPGKTGTLAVTFKKKGSFAYLCTIVGHAKLGMKGTLGIATIQTVLTHAGTYMYECDVPRHAELGMQGTLTVTG